MGRAFHQGRPGGQTRVPHHERKHTHFTPTIVLYEVYKLVKREFDEKLALEACARIKAYTTTVPIDEELHSWQQT